MMYIGALQVIDKYKPLLSENEWAHIEPLYNEYLIIKTAPNIRCHFYDKFCILSHKIQYQLIFNNAFVDFFA